MFLFISRNSVSFVSSASIVSTVYNANIVTIVSVGQSCNYCKYCHVRQVKIGLKKSTAHALFHSCIKQPPRPQRYTFLLLYLKVYSQTGDKEQLLTSVGRLKGTAQISLVRPSSGKIVFSQEIRTLNRSATVQTQEGLSSRHNQNSSFVATGRFKQWLSHKTARSALIFLSMLH